MSPVDHLRVLAEVFAEPDADPALTALGEVLGGLLELLADQLAVGTRTAAGHDEVLLLALRLGEAVPGDVQPACTCVPVPGAASTFDGRDCRRHNPAVPA